MSHTRDVVVGIDSSTSATKAIGWTRDGSVVGSGRCPIPLKSPGPDRYEQDPEDWWTSTIAALGQLLERVPSERIAAVAISNQRETFVPLGPTGRPVRPAIVWLDQRCKDEVAWLSEKLGPDRLHRVTGKPPDVAPVAYRIAWMLKNEPELFRATAVFADVHSYLAWRLTGTFQTSWASADPLGLLDMRTMTWSADVLQALRLDPDRLPRLAPPCSPIGEVAADAATQTGLIPGTPVVAGGGDGQAAGLGVDALVPRRAYLNLGTAVVSGTYAAQYRTDAAWRTMASCSGEGYYYETSLRAGTFLIDWFARQVGQPEEPIGATLQRLEAEAADVPIGSDGLLAVPYWGAVMTPYWNPLARGCWLGLRGSHRVGHLYRSLLEGIALEQTLVGQMIEEKTGSPIEELVAIGGGAASDPWLRIFADACGKTILRRETVEASSLGAAMCAATGAGWFPTAAEAAGAMAGKIIGRHDPIPSNVARYGELLAIYRELYPRLRDSMNRLSRFAAGE